MEFKVGDLVFLEGKHITTITEILSRDVMNRPYLVKFEECFPIDGRVNVAHVSRLTKIKDSIVDKLLVLYAGR